MRLRAQNRPRALELNHFPKAKFWSINFRILLVAESTTGRARRNSLISKEASRVTFDSFRLFYGACLMEVGQVRYTLRLHHSLGRQAFQQVL